MVRPSNVPVYALAVLFLHAFTGATETGSDDAASTLPQSIPPSRNFTRTRAALRGEPLPTDLPGYLEKYWTEKFDKCNSELQALKQKEAERKADPKEQANSSYWRDMYEEMLLNMISMGKVVPDKVFLSTHTATWRDRYDAVIEFASKDAGANSKGAFPTG